MAAKQPMLTLRVARTLPAAADEVFRAHTTPAELAKWWGPTGFTAPVIELDLRVGGTFRIAMQPPDGEVFHLAGEFLAIEPPNHLAYTFRWEEPDPDDRETSVTLSIDDRGKSSQVTMVQTGFATEARRALHQQGWRESLDRLADLLAH